MPNIAAVLKAEIARVARKEVRGAVESLRKATSAHRSEVAALKRRLLELERQVKKQTRTVPRARLAAAGAAAADPSGLVYGEGATAIIETWTYNFGPRAFLRRLKFVDGRLVKIVTGGYGYAQ